MPDINHLFTIRASVEKVFQAITTPTGLDAWWTITSKGSPVLNTTYELFFGAKWDWRATVTIAEPDAHFEVEMTRADPDWEGTVVGFKLEASGENTNVDFYHTGWKSANAHFRTSSFCWAMYLRHLRRYVEGGTIIPYEDRYFD